MNVLSNSRFLSSNSIAVSMVLFFFAASTTFAEETPEISFDGLVKVDDSAVAGAWVDPDADFSVYSRVTILDPFVAFRDNWLRDQNRGSTRRVRSSDMERIKADVATLLKEVFTERLEADNGYVVVDGAADDVLLLRPAIIDLDVTAPDIQTAGRSSSFTATTGAATLYLELFDSVSGNILGRAVDRQRTRDMGGMITWSTSVTNRAEARRMFGAWADLLREFMDEHYMSADADEKAAAAAKE